MNDIIWLTMRRLRTPLILLLIIFGLSVFGMVLIPGVDAEGRSYQLNFLEAMYFVAILSTTIGFGEIPYAFSDGQRLWTFLIIFPNVATWIYAVGTILGLFMDQQFRNVLARSRFIRQVSWSNQPFYIVCGFGGTGSLVVKGLLHRNFGAAVIEIKPDLVQRMALETDFAHVPALAADASQRDAMECAGLYNPRCQGLITTTNDDHANLIISITCKLLRPELKVLARCESERIRANMASFGTEFIIDPYEIFADRLALAMNSADKFLVQDWLISIAGRPLRERIEPPAGRWIVCGMGRFGTHMVRKLEQLGVELTVIDVRKTRILNHPNSVLGRGTEAHTLIEADVENAVGIIAGTGDDVDNLSIIMTALELNPKLFLVAREEEGENHILFESSQSHLVARRSLIVARRMLAIVTTPLLNPFLQYLANQDEKWVRTVRERLKDMLKGRAPNLWVVDLSDREARGLELCADFSVAVTIGHLSRNTRSEEEENLDCVCLVLERGGTREFTPGDDKSLKKGDRLLFAGRTTARREMLWTLHDPIRLLNYTANINLPRGTIWRWWHARRQHKKAS